MNEQLKTEKLPGTAKPAAGAAVGVAASQAGGKLPSEEKVENPAVSEIPDDFPPVNSPLVTDVEG